MNDREYKDCSAARGGVAGSSRLKEKRERERLQSHRKEIQVILLVKEVALNEETTNRRAESFQFLTHCVLHGDQNKIPSPERTSLPSFFNLVSDFGKQSSASRRDL